MSTFKFQPAVTTLEGRDVPAAHTFLGGGTLTINIDNIVTTNQSAIVSKATHQGVDYITVNGAFATANDQPNGPKIRPAAVTSIVVNGSSQRNVIDLRQVNPATYVNLRSPVMINAGSGDDTVFGSQLRDIIRGGIGNDALSGEGGSDDLYGEAGNDQLRGGASVNLLDGGADKDEMWGLPEGRAVFVGGTGIDTVYGFFAGRDSKGNDIERFYY